MDKTNITYKQDIMDGVDSIFMVFTLCENSENSKIQSAFFGEEKKTGNMEEK